MNNLTTVVPSTLLKEKLARLAIKLQQLSGPQGTTDFATYEQVITEAFKLLSDYYQGLSEPLFTPILSTSDTPPLVSDYNKNFSYIEDDLKTIFAEYQNLQGAVLGEFNYMITRLNKLQSKVKSINSYLGDYSLTTTNLARDTIYFVDSFNNLQRVEVNSPLLNAEQCEIDQVEGIVTLPIDRQAQSAIKITSLPVINSNSNGISGNNQEAGASLHGTLSDILDGNADTWFEYERVVSVDDGVPLLFDITINLDTPKVINSIRINPNNFGTRTPVQIITIATSYDGKNEISIKDDIPFSSFALQKEEEVFSLASTTSKYAGQGFFTFTPRKAKYVHLSFKQTTPYLITTSDGSIKNRYAIGIRDIEIAALPYKEVGEVVSTNYSFSEEISKVAIDSNQLPDPSIDSSLVSIEHFVSPDNGVTWYPILALGDSGIANEQQTVPTVLDFNGPSSDTVVTTSPVQTLRYKAILKRNPDAFSGSIPELATEISDAAEMYPIPTSAPFTFILQHTPIANTIRVIDPRWLGAEKTSAFPVAKGNGDKLIVNLPFTTIPRSNVKTYSGSEWILEKKNDLLVTVNGQLWTEGTLTGAYRRYNLSPGIDKISAQLEFGDGTNGEVVSPGAIVAISKAYAETIFPEGEDHIAKLDYPVANDKDRVTITYYYPTETTSVTLEKGATQFTLGPNIDRTTLVFSDTSVFASYEVDKTQLSSGKYSFDTTTGTLYSYDRTSTVTDTTVTYSYTPTKTLTKSDWDFTDSEGISDSIQIFDNGYITSQDNSIAIPSGKCYFNLARLSIIPGTVSFTRSSGTIASLVTEVPFIDGFTEILGAIKTAEEIPALTTGLNSFRLKLPIHSSTSLNISFSRTDIFTTLVIGTPSSTGEYSVDRSTGIVLVKTSSAYSDAGNITYYYQDNRLSRQGYYSINYKTGEVYTYSSTPTESGIVASYQFTNYKVLYNAARLVSSTDWEFDVTNNKITLANREVLSNFDIPSTTGAGGVTGTKYYEVVYKYVKSARESVSELEPFFSPILKDYAIKAIPRSRLY